MQFYLEKCSKNMKVLLNTKFKYSEVEKGGTARKYANSLDWLRDANLVRYCYNCIPPEFPLAAYVRDEQS